MVESAPLAHKRITLAGWLMLLGGATVASGDARDGPDVDLRLASSNERIQLSITFNLAFVNEITHVPRADPGRVSADEVPAVQAALMGFVRDHVRVDIDDATVAPVLERFEAFDGEPGLAAIYPRYGMEAASVVQMILNYPVEGVASRFALTWGYYPQDVLATRSGEVPPMPIRAVLRSHPGWRTITLTQDQPTYGWDVRAAVDHGAALRPVPAVPPRGIRLPALSIGIVGVYVLLAVIWVRHGRIPWAVGAVLPVLLAALALRNTGRVAIPGVRGGLADLDAADVRTIFEPLQENIYRAFDYTTESQIYDALQASVAGPLLDDIYSQIYHSLFIQLVDGAAVSRVERYALLNVAALDTLNDGAGDPGLQVEAEWRVTGVVAHWGHEHRRTHHYRGRYDISATPAGWRIVSGEILTQLRLPPQDPGTNGEADPRSRESADG